MTPGGGGGKEGPVPARVGVALLAAGLGVWAALAPGWAAAQVIRRPFDAQRLAEPRRAPMTLTPFVTVVEEFNDNIFLDNDRKEWDVITRITPGILFEVEEPVYRVAAAYAFTADIFARHPERNGAFNHHTLTGDARWRVNPRLTLTATESLTFSTDTNLLADEVATGRDRALSNSLGAGAAYQLDRLTSVRGGVSWTTQRYDNELLRDSDTYGVDLGLDRALTPRLTGGVEYAGRRFEIDRAEDATTHTPRLAVSYRFTETLTGRLAGGPTFVVEDHAATVVTPTFTASLSQAFRWGNLGLDVARAVGTAGGLGGVTLNHSVGVTAQLTTLMRGLVIEGGPRWAMRESVRGDDIDLWNVVLPVQATYRFREGVVLVAAYNFFLQRSDSQVAPGTPTSLARDVDQHRLWIGVQLGYPIRFE